MRLGGRAGGAGRAKEFDPADVLTPLAERQVGYRVLARPVVLLVLGGFAAAVLVMAFVGGRRGRLEWAAITAAVAAVVAAGVLITLGALQQSKTPATAAEASLDLPHRGTPYVSRTLVTGVYRPPGSPETNLSGQGADPVLTPDLSTGGLVRLVWTDLDVWRFDGLETPTGAVRPITLTAIRTFETPLAVTGTLTEQGLMVDVPVKWLDRQEDLILATPVGLAAPVTTPDHRLLITPEERLRPGQYLMGGMLTQQQQARAAAYEALTQPGGVVDHPMLLTFQQGNAASPSADEPPTLRLDIDVDRPRQRLVALPITFRPPTGEGGGGGEGGDAAVAAGAVPHAAVCRTERGRSATSRPTFFQHGLRRPQPQLHRQRHQPAAPARRLHPAGSISRR